jgi:PTS system mannose-specific IID component
LRLGPERRSELKEERLTFGDRALITLRSFLIQSVWNPRGMQSVGFCFAMLPVARRLRLEGSALSSFLTRHLGFFNTNPAMASYVLGAAAAAEVRGDTQSVDGIKKGLAGPLGMAGDALLWGAARPFAGLLAVALLDVGLSWAPLALLVFYNIPHLFFRVRGTGVGARLGPSGARELSGRGLRVATVALRGGGAFVAGWLVASAVRGESGIEPWKLVATLSFLALAYAAARWRMPTTLVAAGGALGSLALLAVGLNGG